MQRRIVSHQISYGSGMHNFHWYLGALVSWWLNETFRSFLLDQTARSGAQRLD
jgi:hypothetical protein